MLAVLLVSVVMSWFAVRMERARKQRRAVAAITRLGGTVVYDQEVVRFSRGTTQIDIPVGVSIALDFDFRVPKAMVNDHSIVDLTALSQNKLQLAAAKPGTTQVAIWDVEENVHQFNVTAARERKGSLAERVGQLLHLVDHLFSSVHDVDLGEEPVTDADLVVLHELPELVVLNLSGSRVTDNGLKHLECFSSLRVLYLTRTRVSSEGVKRLKETLKECEIVY